MQKLLKIYLWQCISIVVSFGSIFIVTPYLSSNQSIYGIYSLIASLLIFISYGDFGFISAGIKYASECFVRDEREQEVKIIGFVSFILGIFVLIYIAGLLVISYNPYILASNLTVSEASIATRLLFILAISSPVYVAQRILQIIFSIRLDDYLIQKVFILFNSIKILSVLYFFRSGRYDIISYFWFSQLCTFGGVIIGVIVAKNRLAYKFCDLIKAFRFNKQIYQKTKDLAYSSLFLTVCWILYYELDQIAIGKMMGARQLAIYAIGISLTSLLRSLFGIFFTPFTAKFNHFIGLNNKSGLEQYFLKIVIIAIAFTTFPVIAIAITTRYFIFNWVGNSYHGSITIAQILVLGYVFSFLTSPAEIVIMAFEKVKQLIITSAALPLVYWLGIIFFYQKLGLVSFALFKLIAATISSVVFLINVLHLFNWKWKSFQNRVLLPSLAPIATLIGYCYFISRYLPAQKGNGNLIIYGCYIAFGQVLAIGIYYLTSKIFRLFMNEICTKILINLQRIMTSSHKTVRL